jgi:hypothetical protein
MSGSAQTKPRKPLAKTHATRLQKMLAELDSNEVFFQAKYGDLVPKSMRATKKLNADALRAALEHLQGVDE